MDKHAKRSYYGSPEGNSLINKTKILTSLVLVILISVAVSSASIGIDYGKHWDEWYLSRSMEHSVRNLIFAPQTYFYPGMYFIAGYLILSPDIASLGKKLLSDVAEHPSKPFTPSIYPAYQQMQDELIAKVQSNEFRLSVRQFYIFISSLTILLTFLLIRALERSSLEALMGAGLIALSWEINYHSRHIAIDNMLMMFGSLTLFAVFKACAAEDTPGKGSNYWRYAAAIGAGLAAGTKIPAGFLLFIPLIVCVAGGRGSGPLKVRLVIPLVFTMLGVFVLTTPGMFLDPVRVVNDWMLARFDYMNLPPSYPYSVASPPAFILGLSDYFLNSALSPYRLISLPLTLFSLVGLVSLFRESRRKFSIFISFPIVYIAVISSVHLLIVRNLLVLFPFFAALAARGFIVTFTKVSNVRLFQWGLILFLGCWAVMNSYWLFYSANTVRPLDTALTVRELNDYIGRHRNKSFTFSPLMRSIAASHPLDLDFSSEGSGSGRYCALNCNEIPDGQWKANKRDYFHHVIGSLEVNYDYYPDWIGNNRLTRIVIMDEAKALEAGIQCSPVVRGQP